MTNFARESALSRFGQRNGELLIGNRSISDLAEEYGTPLYIYDRGCLAWRYQTLCRALPSELKIYYAVKANPYKEIIRAMGQYYDGFDIASQGEMERVIRAGISSSRLSFAGPGKSSGELRSAIEHDIGSISVESEREIEIIRSICESLDTKSRILLRVNPPFELSQSGMRMGGGPRQFGIDSERLPMVIERIRRDDRIQFEGIHIFAGSQNLEAYQLVQTFGKILQYCAEIAVALNVALPRIDMGGGFGIPYFAHERDLDLDAVGIGLEGLVADYQRKLPSTTFVLELGRFLVGECGLYLTRILYRKVSHDKVFLVTDGGMHHHLAASGNFGQSLVRRPMPLITANRLNDPVEKVSVCGRLCTPLDTFGTIDLPKAMEGDLIAILNSGAYGLSASPTGFLSHEPAKEVIV